MVDGLGRAKADGLCAAFGVDVYNRCERCECSTTLYIESVSFTLRKYINSLSADLRATLIASPTSRPLVLEGNARQKTKQKTTITT